MCDDGENHFPRGWDGQAALQLEIQADFDFKDSSVTVHLLPLQLHHELSLKVNSVYKNKKSLLLFLTFTDFRGKAECTADLLTVIVVAAQLEVIGKHAASGEAQTHT